MNDGVQVWLLDATRLAPTYPASAVLRPPTLNPYYDVTDVKPVNGAAWPLELGGLIDQTRPWTLAELEALPQRTTIIKHVCVEGWTYVGLWTGVPLRTLLECVGADLRAKYVSFRTADDYPAALTWRPRCIRRPC